MKWLKLDCDFRNDPKVQALARQWGGQEAAGFWTLLLGFIGAHGGTTCRVRIAAGTATDERYFAAWFSAVPRTILARVTAAARLGLVCETSWQDDQTIFIPNMMKRVDDYSRRVAQSPNNVRTHSAQRSENPALEEEVEEEREIEERKKGEKGKESPAEPHPALVTLGEFGWVRLTPEKHERLKEALNSHTDEFIRRYDGWVQEAPEAKHRGVKRKDRDAYASILNWYHRDRGEGKLGSHVENNPEDVERERQRLFGKKAKA